MSWMASSRGGQPARSQTRWTVSHVSACAWAPCHEAVCGPGVLLASHVLSSLRLHQPLCGRLEAGHVTHTSNVSPGWTHPWLYTSCSPEFHAKQIISTRRGRQNAHRAILRALCTLLTPTRRAAAVKLRFFSMPLPLVLFLFTAPWPHTTNLLPLLRTGHARELRSLARHACRKLASLVGRSAVWLGQSVEMARQVCGPYISFLCRTGLFARLVSDCRLGC